MLSNTILVGIIPIMFFGFRNQLKMERMHQKKAENLTAALDDNYESKRSVNESSIIALEAMQNYVHFYSLTTTGTTKETKRITLQNAQETLNDKFHIKCHRSYVVDIRAVHSVSGNAQGLKLTLTHEGCPIIPVSRTYIKVVKEALQKINSV